MADRPRFSVIVPVRDRMHLLRRCLASLAREPAPPAFEVVVVDDGSKTAIADELARADLGLELRVERQIPLGIAAARNLGLFSARGEDVLFLDSDCVLEPGALAALAANMDEHPHDLAFQLRLAGGSEHLSDRLEDLRLTAIQEATRTRDGRVHYANTSGLALRGVLARRRAALFDPGAVRGEDTLLLAELLAEGRPPRLVENACVRHLGGLSLVKYVRKHFAIGYYTGYARGVLEDSRAGLLTPGERSSMLADMVRRSRGQSQRWRSLTLVCLSYALERAGRASHRCFGLRPGRMPVLTLTVEALRERELVARILFAAERREQAIFSYATAWTLVQAHRHPRFAHAIMECDHVYTDGMGVVLSLFLLRFLRCHKITAGDFFLELCEGARRRGLRIAIVGTRPELLERGLARLEHDVPGVPIFFAHHGFVAGEERASLVTALRRADPHLVVLGMGQPLQEHLAAELRSELRATVHCVGGLFDQLAGVPPPPPLWVRRVGFEWLYRLAAHPRRLWRRYLLGLPALAWILLCEVLSGLIAWPGEPRARSAPSRPPV